MFFWFDWVKSEYSPSKQGIVNRNAQIKKIKNLRKTMITTAIPLWIISTILLVPIMDEYYKINDSSVFDFANNYFKFGILTGFLGTAIIGIGIFRLFTIQEKLDMYYLAEKQLQFS
jgi:hypothetical protein